MTGSSRTGEALRAGPQWAPHPGRSRPGPGLRTAPLPRAQAAARNQPPLLLPGSGARRAAELSGPGRHAPLLAERSRTHPPMGRPGGRLRV